MLYEQISAGHFLWLLCLVLAKELHMSYIGSNSRNFRLFFKSFPRCLILVINFMGNTKKNSKWWPNIFLKKSRQNINNLVELLPLHYVQLFCTNFSIIWNYCVYQEIIFLSRKNLIHSSNFYIILDIRLLVYTSVKKLTVYGQINISSWEYFCFSLPFSTI